MKCGRLYLLCHLFSSRVQRGNKIIRYLCIAVGLVGGALSGFMLTQKKTVRKVVQPVDNKVQVIGDQVGDIEGVNDSPMAYAPKY